jgi:6-phosphogluconolactonase (cycloisomerase 2 family)
MKKNIRLCLSSFFAVLLLAVAFTACSGGSTGKSSTTSSSPVSTITSTNNGTGGYTVTYNSNGGTGSVPADSNSYFSGQTVTVPANSSSLAYTGYSFVGWQTKPDGSGSVYAQGQTFPMGSKNVTLYALWAGGYAYVVNQTEGYAASISQYTIGPNGALTPMTTATVATGGNNSQLITADPSGKYVYVSNVSSNTVSQFTVGTNGTLVPMSTPTVLMGTGTGVLYYPFSIAVAPSGKWAYVANNQKSDVNEYDIGSDGSLTPMAAPNVAAGAYPDSVAVDPSGKWAYVANGDANTVSQYTVDQTTGELSPMSTPAVASGQNSYTVTVDPQGKYAYVTSYDSGTISQYDINQTTGALTPMSVATVASGGSPAISITIDPQGRFAYVSIFTATPNAAVAQFNIGADGTLSPMAVPTVSAGGAAAVRIAVEASGKYAYATCGNSGWGSTTVAQYSIDQTTGELTLLNNPTVLAGDSPNGIVTVGK